MPTVDHCPTCNAPTHATEGTAEGHCPACTSELFGDALYPDEENAREASREHPGARCAFEREDGGCVVYVNGVAA